MARIFKSDLKRERLRQLRDQIFFVADSLRRERLHIGGPHPGFLELGRVLYCSATRDFKPEEMPAPLRICPWVFALSELKREFPADQWTEKDMIGYVHRYLNSLAEGECPSCHKSQTEDSAHKIVRIERA